MPTTHIENDLGALEAELADKRAKLTEATRAADASQVIVLRQQINELEVRIGFQRVRAEREAVAKIEGEENPHQRIDITVAMTNADRKRAEAQRLAGEAAAEVESALAESRLPQEWEADRGARLAQARTKLSQAEMAARGSELLVAAPTQVPIDPMSAGGWDALRAAMKGRQQ